LEQLVPHAPSDVAPLAHLARRIAEAPGLTRDAFASEEWQTRRDAITTLLQNGAHLAFLRTKLEPYFVADAWTADTSRARMQLGLLPAAFTRQSFAAFEALARLLPRLKAEGKRLRV
jgi:hypothetical protein